MMRRALGTGLLMTLALRMAAQQPTLVTQEIPVPRNLSATLLLPVDAIVFDVQRPDFDPKRWGFEIHADGHGRYYTQGAATGDSPSGSVWQDVTVSKATMERLLAGSQHDERCETKAKHIANTGQKTLSYVHGAAWFSCTFNYSDNDAVLKASETFQSMATTMQFGERLQHEHRFDRLSLDAEMASLEEEIKAGRAIEVGNIAPTLRSIAEDPRVIDRVRRKAARMLEGIAVEQGNAAEAPTP